MKERKTGTERALTPEKSSVPSSGLQKELIQRGRVDIHAHQTAAKHLKQGADALNVETTRKRLKNSSRSFNTTANQLKHTSTSVWHILCWRTMKKQ